MKWLDPITPTGRAGDHFPFGNFQTALVVPSGVTAAATIEGVTSTAIAPAGW
jgi:hypothetical protein